MFAHPIVVPPPDASRPLNLNEHLKNITREFRKVARRIHPDKLSASLSPLDRLLAVAVYECLSSAYQEAKAVLV